MTRPDAAICSGCGTPVPLLPGVGMRAVACSSCGEDLMVETFPALFRFGGPVLAGEMGGEGESVCFYHESRQAVSVCGECGRFLCSLCEIRLGGRNLCPACVHRGREEERLEALVTRRTLHDGVALTLSVAPLLFFFVTIITAPLAIFMSIRYWNKPGSILPRTKIRFVLAILFSLVQVAGWGFLFIGMVKSA